MKFRSLLTAAVVSLCASMAHAQLSEPDTVFFGRVLNQSGGEPRLLTSGQLAWSIVTSEGAAPHTVRTQLAPSPTGEFSYSVRIPRIMAISGLPGYSVPAGLPLLTDPTERYRHANITVDGHPARLVDPAALSFAAAGTTRADFLRLDLIVDFPLPDTDGDGLPDWWETKYGLDGEAAAALGADTDLDGVPDLAEYRAGTNPNLAGTAPRLAAETILTVPENGRSALLLQAQDSDTPPHLLRYTVQSLPSNVGISVRDGNPDGRTDRAILVGGNFTQAEVAAGRVVVTPAEVLTRATVGLSLVDEIPDRVAVQTSLEITTAKRADLLAAAGLPDAALPATFILHYAAASAVPVQLRAPSGPTAAQDSLSTAAYDFTWTPMHGADEPRVLIGSPLDDTLLGSGENDLLAPGGGTNKLRGYAGSDRFVFSVLDANDTVVDFSAAEGDVLDVSGLLTPTAGLPLSAYLSLQPGPVLRVDANGDGSGYTDAVITLTNAQIPVNLDDAWDAGLIDAGAITPRTTLFATATAAAEEGLAAGRITFRRRGDASKALTVSLTITGTAIAGTDYVSLPSSITFLPGAKIATLLVTPLADDLRELTETIEVALASSTVYDLGTNRVSVPLTDLPSRVWLEVTERSAYKDSLSPGQILIRRSGSLSTSLTALLLTSGRATPAVDYRRLSSSVTFPAGQDVISVEIMPLATATLTGGCEDVIITVKADPAYQFGATPMARIVLCERPQTLAAWRAARQPGIDPESEAFYAADPDGDGFNGLMEFALNLNPNAPDSGAKTQTKLIFDTNGAPGLEFRRWPGAPEIRSEVWQSSDLTHWQPLSNEDSLETSATLESDGLERVCRCLKSKPADGKVYLRLKVSRQ